MLEATEQCQDPVLAESQVLEIPQPETPSQAEIALTDQIVQLWQIHLDFRASIKNETQKFRSLRDELARHLSEMKQVLAKPGRNGQWSSFLKEHKIPRGTADRLVQKYERTLSTHANCLTEQLAEPTEEEIQKLFFKVFPKLRWVLRTPQSVYRFIDLLSLSSDGICRRLTEEGLLLIKPLAQSQSDAPQDLAMEPSPGETAIESQMVSAPSMVESDGELM
jgi:hypothetical protein